MQALHTIHNVLVEPTQTTGKTNLDAPKDDFIFRAYLPDSQSIGLLKKLSILFSGLAVFSLIYSGLSIFYLPTATNSFLAFASLASLFIGVALTIWSTRTLAAEANSAPLSEDSFNSNWEGYHRALFILIALRAASSLVIIPNMLMQGSQANDYTTALGNQTPHVAGLLDSLSTLLPFVELVGLIILAKAGKTVFSYLKEPSMTVQKLISIANFGLLFFSLAIIFHTSYFQNYHNHMDLSKIFSASALSGLRTTAVVTSLFTFFVWAFNFRAWRVPSLVMTGLIFIAMMSFGVYTASNLSNTVDIYSAYANTNPNNHDNFGLKMANVDYHELQEAGCPAKYLFNDRDCPNELVSKIWETPGAVNGEEYGCLNTACAGILAGLYTNPLLEIIGWAFAAIASCLILVIGGAYTYNRHWLNVTNKKSSFRWLAGLIALVVIFLVMQGVYQKSFIREFVGLSKNGQPTGNQLEGNMMTLHGDSLHQEITSLWFLKGLFGPSTSVMMSAFAGLNKGIYDQLAKTIETKDYQYAIIKQDPKTKHYEISQGGWDSYFSQFALEFNNDVPHLAFINFRSGVKRFPILVLHDPHGAGRPLNELYQSFKLTGDLNKAMSKGLVVYATSKAELITHENLLNRANGLDAQTGVVANMLLSTWESPYSDAFKALINKKYQFLVLKQDNKNSPSVVVDSGLWGSTWDDFVKNIDNKKEQVGFMHIGDKGKEKPYMIVFSPKKQSVQQALADYQLPANAGALKALGVKNLKTFFASDKKELVLKDVLAKGF